MKPLTKIFQSLEGTWNFHRTISNYGNIVGTAAFKRSATENNLLHYREEGELKSENGESFQVYREYLYRYQNDRISVFFAEETERLLHTLEFQDTTIAKARHLCSCDVYDATYEFTSLDEFDISLPRDGSKEKLFNDNGLQTLYRECMMRTVAIIGAGPSGLAAAKSAIECGLKPVVLEKSSQIGGLWKPKSGSVWETMHTNISYHTCQFSDFAWKKDVQDFPNQEEVNEYLDAYAGTFKIPPYIQFNSEVQRISMAEDKMASRMVKRQESPGGDF